MRKVFLSFLAFIVIAIMLEGCSRGNSKSDPNTDAGATDTPQKSIEIGDKVDYEVYLLDENGVHFTEETLPTEYRYYDFDCDSLNNAEEIKNGCDMYKVDTDDDGICDYDELYITKTDPTKWSSRDDNVSDLEWSITNGSEFTEGYTTSDSLGFKFYLKKPTDKMHIITKVSVPNFDSLYTITEALQIKNFSGTIAFNASSYVDEVAQAIKFYKVSDDSYQEIPSTVDENRLIIFEVSENDIIVGVYVE